jgi:hypothetical protein
MLRRKVNQIPVVDAGGIAEVKLIDLLPERLVGSLIPLHQHEERQQTVLMERRAEQFQYFRQPCIPILPAKISEHGNTDPPEKVTLAV